jgi:uncharacterized damage-inducible protein DinB
VQIEDIRLLYDYNEWATRKILTASAKLSPEQFVTPAPYGGGSLRGTLVHVLEGEQSWRSLCQHNIFNFSELDQASFPSLEVLGQRWAEEQTAMRDYLASLSDGDMTGLVRYTLDSGQKRERLLWHCLYHLANHGTQHRSEAAVLLTGHGQSPGDVDFTFFLNERR